MYYIQTQFLMIQVLKSFYEIVWVGIQKDFGPMSVEAHTSLEDLISVLGNHFFT